MRLSGNQGVGNQHCPTLPYAIRLCGLSHAVQVMSLFAATRIFDDLFLLQCVGTSHSCVLATNAIPILEC